MLSRPRLLSSALASALLRPRPGRPFHATAPAPRSGGGGGGSAAPATTAASNPAMSFPCLDAIESRSEALLRQRSQSPPSPSSPAVSPTSATSGPEPSYTTGPTLRFHSEAPLRLDWGGVLPSFDIAYETWGSLNADRSNAVLLHTGLSASSHARSTEANPRPGWWESFIGPGLSLDTDRFFVVCANVIGGCFGSTGPSSVDPADGRPYATRFPIVTLPDMVRAQFRLLDGLAIRRLHASVGSSMGGMQSLAAAALFPDRVGRVATTSACGRSHPSGIAMRHAQRQVLMMDPHWNRGFYYDGIPPHAGMKLAREIATVTYRSGPEWGKRFGRRRADPTRPPALCPDFLIETYLDHAGEKFCLTYDPNSLLYVSKAMDLFDLGRENQAEAEARRRRRAATAGSPPLSETGADACSLTLPDRPYEEQGSAGGADPEFGEGPGEDLVAGLAPLRDTPTLVMGVATDILFPAWQQREVADALRLGGNKTVVHRELSQEESLFGHDTFLLDLAVIGKTLKVFLEG